MKSDIDRFLEQIGGPQTSKIKFRPGARPTNPFGLTRRYRVIDGIEWGWPGIHFGVDRAKSTQVVGGKPNGIWSPLDFQFSRFEDWKGQVYGSLIHLYHWAGFTVLIAHCEPRDIEVLDQLQKSGPIKAGEYIAPIGQYGFTDGAHTHTELRASEPYATCEVLDELLLQKYGSDECFCEMSEKKAIEVYRSCERTKDWREYQMVRDYRRLREEKRIMFMNKYKIIRRLNDGHRVYYSSMLTLDF